MQDKPAERQKHGAAQLSEEDFYFEGEYMVFTAAYHRKRGYCCGSGCRHCPFGDKSNFKQDEDQFPAPRDPAEPGC